VNLHGPAEVSPRSLVRSLTRHSDLVFQLTKRDIVGRYKGSVFGLLWSFVNPIILLAMYTFVFSVVFKARWGGGGGNQAQFAVQLFAGMITHTLFSEPLLRAPTIVLSNVSYVKKIVFPLEILPVVTICTAAFHAGISLIVLVTAILMVTGSVPWTIVFLPIVLFPMLLVTLGITWFISALGVYVRDVAQPMGLLTTVLLFASPVFYPASALPEQIQPFIMLNPLTFIIEQVRAVAIGGEIPNSIGLALYSAIALVVAYGGYVWFQKTRKGFANVL
jgi:lipopolysaccharide transport system permease protein